MVDQRARLGKVEYLGKGGDKGEGRLLSKEKAAEQDKKGRPGRLRKKKGVFLGCYSALSPKKKIMKNGNPRMC